MLCIADAQKPPAEGMGIRFNRRDINTSAPSPKGTWIEGGCHVEHRKGF